MFKKVIVDLRNRQLNLLEGTVLQASQPGRTVVVQVDKERRPGGRQRQVDRRDPGRISDGVDRAVYAIHVFALGVPAEDQGCRIIGCSLARDDGIHVHDPFDEVARFAHTSERLEATPRIGVIICRWLRSVNKQRNMVEIVRKFGDGANPSF